MSLSMPPSAQKNAELLSTDPDGIDSQQSPASFFFNRSQIFQMARLLWGSFGFDGAGLSISKECNK